MTRNNSQISAGELAAVLALSRIFSEATSLPGNYIAYGMQRFTAVAVSFLLAGAAYIPLYFVLRRSDGVSPLGLIAGKSKLLSGFIGVLFSLYLLLGAAETGLRSHYYASSTAFDSAPSAYFYIFAGGALLFAARRGIQASARTGLIVSAVLGLLFLLITAALLPDIRTDRLYPVLIDDAGSFTGEVRAEFAQNTELLLLTALCGSVKSRRGYGIARYLAISAGAVIFMTFLYNTVFGRLTSMLDFPFYTLSSVSDIVLLHRINGIDAMVWTMAGIIRLVFFIFAFRAVITDCFGVRRSVRAAGYVFGVAALVLSGLFTAFPEMHEPLRRACSSGIPLLCAAAVIPLLAAIPAGGAGKRKEAAQ